MSPLIGQFFCMPLRANRGLFTTSSPTRSSNSPQAIDAKPVIMVCVDTARRRPSVLMCWLVFSATRITRQWSNLSFGRLDHRATLVPCSSRWTSNGHSTQGCSRSGGKGCKPATIEHTIGGRARQQQYHAEYVEEEAYVTALTLTELYTDESPGLIVDPVVVLVLSLVFIFSVVALHS